MIITLSLSLLKILMIKNIKYKSNQHGLSADYLVLFSYALDFERSRRGDTSYDYEIVLTVWI